MKAAVFLAVYLGFGLLVSGDMARIEAQASGRALPSAFDRAALVVFWVALVPLALSEGEALAASGAAP